MNGKFLLGSYGGTSVYDPSTGSITDNDDKNLLHEINFFKEDNRGNIWCLAQRSVRVFKITNEQVENIKQYKIQGNIRGINDLKIDHKGRILVATNGAGMAVFDTLSKSFTHVNANSSPPSQITNSSTTAICEDHNNCIWIGTQRGINKIEKDGITVKQYSQNKNNSVLLSHWWVNDIKEDKQGIIWFTANENGIGRIDPRDDSISFFNIAQGLPTCWFDQLCIDEDGNLWALSKMGILNLNVVTLQNRLYTEKEGFPSPDNIETIHYSSFTKKLYILTHNSILEVNSKKPIYRDKIPQTTITGFSIFSREQPFPASNQITLNYNQTFYRYTVCLPFVPLQ